MAQEKKKQGRPRAVIDWDIVDEYLIAQCNGAGIAAILGIYPDTLYDACAREFKTTFTAYSQQKKEKGKELLRKNQWDLAMSGDRSLNIWLGKQCLDQSDKHDQKISMETKPLVIQVGSEQDKQALSKVIGS